MSRITLKSINAKEINKDTFSKFKKVRELESSLYGTYHLYSKSSQKFIGIQLPSSSPFVTTRPVDPPSFKVAMSPTTALYLFPLLGEPIYNLGGLMSNASKKSNDGELKRWVDKCGGFEGAMFSVLKKLLQIVEEGSTEIIIDCLRVYNGEVLYCWDGWMHGAVKILNEHPTEMESYYLSQADLDYLFLCKNMESKPKQSQGLQIYHPTLQTVYFRIFLLILHLGTSNLKQRNYQLGAYRINNEHISLKIKYFSDRYNAKGLGDSLRRGLLEDGIMKEVVRLIEGRAGKGLCHNQIRQSQVEQRCMQERSRNIPEQRSKVKQLNKSDSKKGDLSFCQESTPVKQIQSKKKQNLSATSSFVKEQPLHNRQIHRIEQASSNYPTNTTTTMNTANGQNQNEGRQSAQGRPSTSKPALKKSQPHPQNYTLFEPISKKQAMMFKQRLQQMNEPFCSVNLLKQMQLQQYFPISLYEQQVLHLLSTIHLKITWQKKLYENGSIYLGDLTQPDSRRAGKGLYIFASMDLYYGTWHDNLMEGQGTYIFKSGQMYEGELKGGVKEGHGRCCYIDGREYEGSWMGNAKVGLGRVKFPNGVVFMGLFNPHKDQTEGVFTIKGTNGIQHQPGILQLYTWQSHNFASSPVIPPSSPPITSFKRITTQNGQIYQGQLTFDNIRQGFGVCQDEQQIYEGHWKDDRRDGNGRLRVKGRFQIQGTWINGVMVRYCPPTEQIM